MTELRIIIWNIENLGADQGLQQYTRGDNSSQLAEFVVAMVQEYALDIIAIQEVFPGAEPHLRQIVAALNASYDDDDDCDWTGDWIRQSFAPPPDTILGGNEPDITGNDAYYDYPLLFDDGDTSWNAAPTAGVRKEAYALLWRANRAHFKVAQNYRLVSDGIFGAAADRYPNGALNLVARGRPLDYLAVPEGGFNAGRVYSGGKAMARWPLLGFPYNSKQRFEFPRLFWSRRAAYAVLTFPNQGGGQANQLCPLIFYHAPAAETIAPDGATCCAMAREMFMTLQVDDINGHPPTLQDDPAPVAQAHVCAGGDFNYGPEAAGWPGQFQWFTTASGTGWTTGAGCTAALIPSTVDATRGRSTVRLSRRNPDKRTEFLAITTATASDYLGERLDNGFNRGPRLLRAGRINLTNELLTSATFRARVRGALTSAYAAAGYMEHDAGELGGNTDRAAGPQWDSDDSGELKPVFGQADSRAGGFTNWEAFMGELRAAQFATARSAAEFLRKFVSDHLPVFAVFDV